MTQDEAFSEWISALASLLYYILIN